MHVILDTNVFVADFWMQRPSFALLREGLERISGRLVVPSVVLAEVEAKYAERLHEAERDADRAAKAVRALREPGAAASTKPAEEKKQL